MCPIHTHNHILLVLTRAHFHCWEGQEEKNSKTTYMINTHQEKRGQPLIMWPTEACHQATMDTESYGSICIRYVEVTWSLRGSVFWAGSYSQKSFFLMKVINWKEVNRIYPPYYGSSCLFPPSSLSHIAIWLSGYYWGVHLTWTGIVWFPKLPPLWGRAGRHVQLL